jgi:phosphoribosylformimino-5-aminoimidazole carboxamide ribotide isomerase
MILFPAIDLYAGKAVRLYKGDYRQMTVYSENPPELAETFKACGAEYLHTVDLEGARDGTAPNFALVAAFAQKSGLRVQVGGGIRTEETIQKYLDAGVFRVVLGTAAATNPDFLAAMCAKYGDKIAVGADLKDGFVAIRGWTEKSALTCDAYFARLQSLGVKTAVCTDISRDGAMRGTNRALYEKLSRTYALDLVASGGVSSLGDIRALRAMNLYGAIVGKAYYTGAIDLRAALEAAG